MRSPVQRLESYFNILDSWVYETHGCSAWNDVGYPDPDFVEIPVVDPFGGT